ncbi:MAG: DsbA family protein [Oscillospiraceae bacterium]|nr:DsbA family protein [Oscillospiraceae bacterium]
MPKIEVFFDHTCPYCDRGLSYLWELLPKYQGVDIVWCPVEAHPKNEEPEHRPWQNLAVQASLCVRDLGADEVAYHKRLFKAYFEEKLSVEDTAVLAKCAEEIGADRSKVEAALKDAKYEKQQLAANDYAYEQKDVWAVPTFVGETTRLDSVAGIGVTKAQVEKLLAECSG